MVENDEARDREVVKKGYESSYHVDYHERQFREAYRSTVRLIDFVSRVLDSPSEPFRAIDVGCGGGANIFHLSRLLPNTQWVGQDWAEQFFDVGRSYMAKDKVACEFVKGDFYELTKDFGSKSFDLAFSIQTLSWLPRYEDALSELLAVAGRWVFVTSLFTDHNVDVVSRVFPYEGPPWVKPSPYFYNVYCYPRFRDFCLANGARDLVYEDFVMDIDLREPETGSMGTFTRKLEGGRRLQFSGPLHLPWRMVAIRMS